jgi:uncharacterized membrane protein YkvA (DUF1232 family)
MGKDSEHKCLDYYPVLRRRVLSRIARRRNSGRTVTPGERKLLDCLMLLPDLFHLCARLVFDREVPAQNKGPLVAAVVYVMSPVDIIPDLIPVLGWVDDILVLALALNRLLQRDDPAIERCISRYWHGSDDLLETVRHVLATVEAAARFLPDRFMPVIRGILRRRSH